jgi:hypothetical protein
LNAVPIRTGDHSAVAHIRGVCDSFCHVRYNVLNCRAKLDSHNYGGALYDRNGYPPFALNKGQRGIVELDQNTTVLVVQVSVLTLQRFSRFFRNSARCEPTRS